MFTATIHRREFRGQVLFWATISLGSRRKPVLRLPESESLDRLRCEVLDWATRQGKRLLLNWCYEFKDQP